jgi:HSP20 family protein
MERLFDGLSGGSVPYAHAGVFPLINLSEDGDHYYVRAELPGIKAEDLNISVTGDGLSISGERKISEKTKGATYHRRERESGTFSRMISHPGPVETDKVKATSKDGILTIVMPKAEKAKPRQISVKAS